MTEGGKIICGWLPWACEDLIALMGDTSGEYTTDKVQYWLAHFPNGMTLKNILHLYYLKKLDIFGPFPTDLEHPEIYDFSSIMKVPISLYSGEKDNMADPEDTLWLKKQLVSALPNTTYHQYTFGHLGFLLPKTDDDPHLIDTLNFFAIYN